MVPIYGLSIYDDSKDGSLCMYDGEEYKISLGIYENQMTQRLEKPCHFHCIHFPN